MYKNLSSLTKKALSLQNTWKNHSMEIKIERFLSGLALQDIIQYVDSIRDKQKDAVKVIFDDEKIYNYLKQGLFDKTGEERRHRILTEHTHRLDQILNVFPKKKFHRTKETIEELVSAENIQSPPDLIEKICNQEPLYKKIGWNAIPMFYAFAFTLEKLSCEESAKEIYTKNRKAILCNEVGIDKIVRDWIKGNSPINQSQSGQIEKFRREAVRLIYPFLMTYIAMQIKDLKLPPQIWKQFCLPNVIRDASQLLLQYAWERDSGLSHPDFNASKFARLVASGFGQLAQGQYPKFHHYYVKVIEKKKNGKIYGENETTIEDKTDEISNDLLKRPGGLTAYAFFALIKSTDKADRAQIEKESETAIEFFLAKFHKGNQSKSKYFKELDLPADEKENIMKEAELEDIFEEAFFKEALLLSSYFRSITSSVFHWVFQDLKDKNNYFDDKELKAYNDLEQDKKNGDLTQTQFEETYHREFRFSKRFKKAVAEFNPYALVPFEVNAVVFEASFGELWLRRKTLWKFIQSKALKKCRAQYLQKLKNISAESTRPLILMGKRKIERKPVDANAFWQSLKKPRVFGGVVDYIKKKSGLAGRYRDCAIGIIRAYHFYLCYVYQDEPSYMPSDGEINKYLEQKLNYKPGTVRNLKSEVMPRLQKMGLDILRYIEPELEKMGSKKEAKPKAKLTVPTDEDDWRSQVWNDAIGAKAMEKKARFK